MLFIVGCEKGGVGKSMIAVNIALMLKNEGADVILVDTDSTSTSSGWHDIRNTCGLTPALPVIKATASPIPTIVDLCAKYDAVVVDIGARDYKLLGALARIADFWLAPTDVSQGALDSMLQVHSAISEVGHLHRNGAVPFAVVLNRCPTRGTEDQDAKEYLLENGPGIRVLESTLHERKGWRDCGKSGRGLLELSKKDAGKALEELDRMYREVLTSMSGRSAKPAHPKTTESVLVPVK